MATSKKEPLYPRKERTTTTRMSPNLRPSSSSESSSGYGARRARSVPSSPDRKFGPSAGATAAAAAAAPSASPDMCPRPSLSAAGRSVSSRTMSSSGSYIHGGKPSTGAAASKPSLARAKSYKVRTTATSQRPPALAVPPSNSFKDMAKTAAKSPSTLPKSKVSPRPCTEKGVGIQRAPSPGASRGGKITPPVSSARAPVAAAKKRVEKAANGGAGASASSRATSASQRTMGASATRKEKEEEPSMQFEASESLTTSIEDHLHKQLPDPVDLKSMDSAASGSVRHGHQQEPYSEQQGKSGEEVEKEDAGGGCELRNGRLGADELEGAEKEEAKAKAEALANRTEVTTQSWRKDDPRSNDVIEETKSKLLEERKSRVKALVGAFETVMSFKE